MSSPLVAFPQPDDADFLAELGGLFMACKMLFTGVNVGLFEKLAERPLTLDELAAAADLPRRSVHVLAHGLVALGVLELKDGRFANGAAAQARLSGRGGGEDLRPALRLYDQITVPLLSQLDHSVRTGQPARTGKPSAEFAKLFSEGVDAFTRPAAAAMMEAYDFSRHRRVLDLCGGTGSYLLPLLRRHAGLKATLYELPNAAEVARRLLEADPHGRQVEIVEGDALFDPIPSGHDVVILANTIHLLSPDKVQRLFERLRAVVAPGCRLVMPEHWVDASHTRPLFAALVASTFLVLSGDGSSYSVEEGRGWFAATGWKMLEHRPLFGAISMVVAEAV